MKKNRTLFNKTAMATAILMACQPVFAEGPSISGALEVEVSSAKDFSGVSSSDITLATVEVAMEGKVNKRVDYTLSFLYEEGDTDFNVDEGYLKINMPRSKTYFSAGRLYVPFGNYTTAMVSDPVTLEMGETLQTVVQYGFESKTSYGSVYAFNSEKKLAGSTSSVSDFGANFGFKMKDMDFGVGYMNNMAATASLSDKITTDLQTKVAGMSAHAVMNFGKSTIVVEYVSAMSAFDSTNFDLNGGDAKPSAYNVEYSYNGDMTFGVAYQATAQAQKLDLPMTKILVAVSKEVYEGTSVAFEYASSTDYSTADGGTGNNANSMVAKLAVEF